MVEGTRFTIGAEANCTDGVCGLLSQVVIDPLRQTLTHLVVEPKHHEGLGRLVPVDLAEVRGDQILLGCTMAEFEQLERAERTWFMPDVEGQAGYERDEVLLWPLFGGTATVPVTFDALPVGEVAFRRGEHVHATDGHVGRVKGLVVDRGSNQVSHVLLQEGHPWGRREVAIPLSVVSAVGDDGIRLAIRKKEVQDLPAIELGPATR